MSSSTSSSSDEYTRATIPKIVEPPKITHKQLFVKNPTSFRKFCIIRFELCTAAEFEHERELQKLQEEFLKNEQDLSTDEQKLSDNGNQLPKNAFVTVGATATFEALVRAVLDPAFLKELRLAGYTNLVVQHGDDYQGIVKEFDRKYPPGTNHRHGIWIETFDFKRGGLTEEFMKAQGQPKDSKPGVIISHAGTGSILEGLRAGIPLIVVPNPRLLDNHQEELAKVLDSVGLVVHADVGNLAAALPKVEVLRSKNPPFPPPTDAEAQGKVAEVERLLSVLEMKPSQDAPEAAPADDVPPKSEDIEMTGVNTEVIEDHDKLQCYD